VDHSGYQSYSLAQLYKALDTVTEAEKPGMRKRIEARIRELEDKDVPVKGICGWLYVMGLGLMMSVLRLGRIIYGTYFALFTDGVWQALTTPGATDYHPLGAHYLVAETMVLVALMAADIALFFLFITRRRIFPRSFIMVSIAGVVLLSFDVWIVRPLFPHLPTTLSPLMTHESFVALVRCLVGVTYMLRSERVRRTFTR
jgi:hypothetical protein